MRSCTTAVTLKVISRLVIFSETQSDALVVRRVDHVLKWKFLSFIKLLPISSLQLRKRCFSRPSAFKHIMNWNHYNSKIKLYRATWQSFDTIRVWSHRVLLPHFHFHYPLNFTSIPTIKSIRLKVPLKKSKCQIKYIHLHGVYTKQWTNVPSPSTWLWVQQHTITSTHICLCILPLINSTNSIYSLPIIIVKIGLLNAK